MDARTVGNIVGVFGYGEDQLEANVRITLYTIGIAVGALALGSAAIAGQHAVSARNAGPAVIPAHVHIRHVMTTWTDTPNTQGLLPVAIADAKVAATHAELMQTSADDLDVLKLHAGHVLHALDPTLEAKGPGSGYGVKRAAAGALQHIQLAAKSEGASQNVQTHAGHVSASLSNVVAWSDEATATAQRIRTATSASEASPLLAQLIV